MKSRYLRVMLDARPGPGKLRRWLGDCAKATAKARGEGKPFDFDRWWSLYHHVG